MPIKIAIIDREGTTYNPFTHKLLDGTVSMIEDLEARNVRVFIASGQGRSVQTEKLYPIPRDRFVAGTKGTKQLVETIKAATGATPNEIVYFGDGENDMREAVNSNLAYFHATYSDASYPYGLAMASPQHFVDHIERYFLKANPWYLTFDTTDKVGNSVCFRSLLDADSAINTGAQAVVKGWRDDYTPTGSHYSIGYHVILHLISSIYLTGLHLERVKGSNPCWCLYPGHTGSYGSLMQLFEEVSARLLRARFEKDLLFRHTPAESSKEIKMRHQVPLIADQFNTVAVKSDLIRRVKNNVVLVADDFSTRSQALETARNLLYAAGAQKVITIAVGKYGGSRVAVYSPTNWSALTPQSRKQVAESDCPSTDYKATTDPEVLELFRQL